MEARLRRELDLTTASVQARWAAAAAAEEEAQAAAWRRAARAAAAEKAAAADRCAGFDFGRARALDAEFRAEVAGRRRAAPWSMAERE
ncbi:hypothetical protein LTR53_018219, partial [Teratosphaeriaceae sp. CCFEE 6253]